ncbi:unnamed protein product [Sphenostylis stenocarpa]|uniref:Uncharacterized protein n=1 Tax=Sphenostylis stenocarpa TaxID=92480 RepID=A0AA86RZR6_9FABA|nr:unnamed protein product [Sphenostylis stenocarpa]
MVESVDVKLLVAQKGHRETLGSAKHHVWENAVQHQGAPKVLGDHATLQRPWWRKILCIPGWWNLKRCSWGHPGPEHSNQHSLTRGKTGPCALHSGLVLDKRVHGGVSSGPAIQDIYGRKLDVLKQIVINQYMMDVDMIQISNPQTAGAMTCSDAKLNEVASTHLPAGEDGHTPMLVAVPEGRVHGGSLMAMLKGNSGLGTSVGRGLLCDSSLTSKACIVSMLLHRRLHEEKFYPSFGDDITNTMMSIAS